jgi:hypothetical protein
MYFKGKNDRPRPSQICPALLPPIQVPGHSSFPSGHATQAHLIAECAKLVLSSPVKAALSADLDALAGRIARNREIAGLHYKTDSEAGLSLANSILGILNSSAMSTSTTITLFTDALTAARAEWP